MKLTVEMSQHNNGAYGKVHRDGCRHVRDGEPIGEHTSLASLATAIEDEFGWEVDDESDVFLAPCVKF